MNPSSVLFTILVVTALSQSAVADPPDIYSVANSCYVLQAGSPTSGRYVQENSKGYVADASTLQEATAFYFKPTRLGAYLLLSDYERRPGELGRKALLGISDPAGEFLDQSGNFIGEAGVLASGVGDMLGLVLDAVTPAGRVVRAAGENVSHLGGRLGSTNVSPELGRVERASDLAVWEMGRAALGGFQFTSVVTGQKLVAVDGQLGVSQASEADEYSSFYLTEKPGCATYPEAELNAKVIKPPRIYHDQIPAPSTGIDVADNPASARADPSGLPLRDREIYGYIDAHAHITAYEFMGGRVNYGSVFHKFGVDHALGDCEEDHGPNGSAGLVEIAVSSPSTTGHETQGWPSYNFWPQSHSIMHEQSYYRWLERAHLSGMKMLVNLIVHNEALCQVNPQKEHDCDVMENVRLQAKRTYEIQDYVDAQAGGPGKGFFRVVTSPSQAREVIANGQLAVVMGIEVSKLFDCGEYLDQPECTREDIIAGLDEVHDLGVRTIFPNHKWDNAFGGHLLHSGFAFGTILTAGNLVETGHLIEVDNCPENYQAEIRDPDEFGLLEQLESQLEYLSEQGPPSKGTPFEGYDPRKGTPEGGDPRAGATTHLCNIRGLTELGEFLIDQLIERKMIIEIDHMSSRSQNRVLEITGSRNYPVTSSHGWVRPKELLQRIIAQGGTINQFARPDHQSFIDKIMRIKSHYNPEENPYLREGGNYYPASGFTSDVAGLTNLPPSPEKPAGEVSIYPEFYSEDGNVLFSRQVTGDRVFEYYDDRGVDHFGLFPEHFAHLSRHGGEKAEETMEMFFRSAEGYLRMWELVTGERTLTGDGHGDTK